MEENKTQEQSFWTITKKYLKILWEYLIKTFNGMALGLFSTLIVGTIIGNIGKLLDFQFFIDLATLLKTLTGVGIGIGIAYSLKLEGLKLIGAGVAGGIASGLNYGNPGDPLVIFFTVIFSIEIVKLIMRVKTPLDILLIPLIYVLCSYGIYLLISAPLSSFTKAIGNFIDRATTIQPFFMGIVISVVMGMLLTAPISSAAIAIAIGLNGIAGGAALVGCCVQMVGFAVMSRKDNNIGTIISVGIGTSMLQFKNILKKPIIWLPTIIVSAILGPIATLVFKSTTSPVGAGMGTSGLVGQFETFADMGSTLNTWLTIGLLHIALPIIMVWGLDLLFRKKGWIVEGDLKV